MKIWTTKDLLYTVLEFISLVPNSDEWNQKSLAYNEPRLIRFRRIKSLLEAFDLIRTDEQKRSLWTLLGGKDKVKEDGVTKNGIVSFLNGDFIHHRETIECPNVKKLIEKEKVFDTDIFRPRDISSFYNHLMKYRMEIDNTLRFNNQFMEMGGLGFRTAYMLTSELNDSIYMEVDEIDRLIIEIINPLDRSIHQNLLVEQFDFPKDDLHKIDLDNW